MPNQILSGSPISSKNVTNSHAGAILSIDLGALTSNYHFLTKKLGGRKPSAVIKADGYGLGALPIAITLANAGCQIFFVANLEEGIRLRNGLNETEVSEYSDTEIHVLSGLMSNTEDVYEVSRLIPVLGSLNQIYDWKVYCQRNNEALPCDIHVDTGISRLGLPPVELAILEIDPSRIESLNISLIISHLACADKPDHTKNKEQLIAFNHVRKVLPQGRASLANSSGIFLGTDYHFDLARPGAALYGLEPITDQANPMAQVVRLQGKIAQIRDIDTPQTVGYGATHCTEGPARIATVSVGYADGYSRHLSSKGIGYIGDFPVPIVGRISMDLITFNITGVPENLCQVGNLVDLIGPNNPVDVIARDSGTIGYEVLTNLGSRFHRRYMDTNQAGVTP